MSPYFAAVIRWRRIDRLSPMKVIILIIIIIIVELKVFPHGSGRRTITERGKTECLSSSGGHCWKLGPQYCLRSLFGDYNKSLIAHLGNEKERKKKFYFFFLPSVTAVLSS